MWGAKRKKRDKATSNEEIIDGVNAAANEPDMIPEYMDSAGGIWENGTPRSNRGTSRINPYNASAPQITTRDPQEGQLGTQTDPMAQLPPSDSLQSLAPPPNPIASMPPPNEYPPSSTTPHRDTLDSELSRRTDDKGDFIDNDRKHLDAEGNMTSGKNSALKNFFKGLGIGFLQGGLPGALAMGIINTKQGNLDEQWGWDQFHRPNLERNAAREQQQTAFDADQDYRNTQIDALNNKPEIEQNKLDARAAGIAANNIMREYNATDIYSENNPADRAKGDVFQKHFGYRPPEKTTDVKSEQLIDQRDGQVYLIQTDKKGNEVIKRLTNNDGSPMRVTTKEQLASSDREAQRILQEKLQNSRNITAIKLGEMGINSRERIATQNNETKLSLKEIESNMKSLQLEYGAASEVRKGEIATELVKLKAALK